jgi:hypothetical protein
MKRCESAIFAGPKARERALLYAERQCGDFEVSASTTKGQAIPRTHPFAATPAPQRRQSDNPRGRRLLAIAVGPRCGKVKLPNSPDPFADQDLSRYVFDPHTT